MVYSGSVKNAGAILIGIALNVQITSGSIDILTIFNFLVHERGMFLHFLCVFCSFLKFFLMFIYF